MNDRQGTSRRFRLLGWGIVAAICLAALLLAVRSPESGKASRVTNGAKNTNAEAEPAALLQSRISDARALYQSVVASVPKTVSSLREKVDVAHDVSIDEALGEMTRYREGVLRLESDDLPSNQETPQGTECRVFAPLSRLKMGESESIQEMSTDESPTTGPEGEILIHNGEVRLQRTDLALPFRGGLGFSFARIYRSHVNYDGPLGPGWDHIYNQRLVADGLSHTDTDRLDWITGFRRTRFEREGDKWHPDPGAFYDINVDDTEIVIRTPTLKRFTFEPAETDADKRQYWRLRSIASRHDDGRANVLTCYYRPETDLLIRVTDAYGNSIRFAYNSEGRLRELRHGESRIRYDYGEDGCLASVTNQSVALSLRHTENVTEKYFYEKDDGGRIWLRALVPPGERQRRLFEYEHAADSIQYGRVTTIRITNNDKEPKTLAEWSISVARDEYRHFSIAVSRPSPSPSIVYSMPPRSGLPGALPSSRAIPAREAMWRYDWNRHGLLKVTHKPLGGQVRRKYDSEHENPLFRGNLLTKRHLPRKEENRIGITEFGTRWKYHPEISAPRNRISYEVPIEGEERVLCRETWKRDPKSLDVVEERVGDQARFFVRNRYGLIVAEYDSRGSVVLSKYYEGFNEGPVGLNGAGLLAEEIRDADPAEVARELKWAEIPTGGIVPDRSIPVAPVERRTLYYYDKMGNVARVKHPYYEIRTVCNKLGDALSIYDTRSDLILREYDSSCRLHRKAERCSFLARASYAGEELPGIRGRFLVQEFSHDAMGRMASWRKTLQRMGADEKVPTVLYKHYPNGQLRERTAPGGTTVAIAYNAQTGFLAEKKLVANGEQLVLQKDFDFDKEGFLRGYTDDCDERHIYLPDSLGREFSYESPDGVEHLSFHDGLGRVVRSVDLVEQFGDESVIKESRSRFDENDNLLRKRIRRLGKRKNGSGNTDTIDEWLTQRQAVYDSSGNMTESWSWREQAVSRYRYDGLNRQVWAQNAELDAELTLYKGERAVLHMQKLNTPGQQATKEIGSATLFNERQQAWLQVPIGTDGEAAFGRSRVKVHNSIGRPVASARPGKTLNVSELDSLKQCTRQVTKPLDNEHGEKEVVRHFKYDLDGNLIERTLENRALVFAQRGLERERERGNEIVAESAFGTFQVSVPQKTTWGYDGFWRETLVSFSDGRKKKTSWGTSTTAESVTWFGQQKAESDGAVERQKLWFEYDSMHRVKLVKDDAGRTIQRFDYDSFGNISLAVDQGNPEFRVATRRSFDNIGNLLDEQVSLRDGSEELRTALVSYEHDIARGIRTVVCNADKDAHGALWRRKKARSDLSGRVTKVNLDNEKALCRYEYLGPVAVEKDVPSAGIRLDVGFSSLLEPMEYTFHDTNAREPLSHLRYLLDPQGDVTASTMKLREPSVERTFVYEHNSHGQLVAEGSEAKVYDDVPRFRRNALTDPGYPGAYRVRWYRYDEAGNRKEQYRGIEPRNLQKSTGNGGSEEDHTFLSQAAPLEAESFIEVEGQIVDEMPWSRALSAVKQAAEGNEDLTSNRLGAIATRDRLLNTFKYDPMGRLQEYTHYRHEEPIKWHLRYDALGRLSAMHGSKADDESERVFTLRFAYDAFNRRILKKVTDQTGGGEVVQERLTCYTGRNPLLIQSRAGEESPWRTTAQYAWGPGSQELLMAALPRSSVEDAQEDGLQRYFFHQDRHLNVFMCTSLAKGNVKVHDIANYWGFGENCTEGDVVSMSSTADVETGSDSNVAADGVLDGRRATWLTSPGGGRLTLELDRSTSMDQLTIWSDKFPRSFRVYVVPENGEAMPPKERVEGWEREAQSRGWRAPLATVTDGKYLRRLVQRQRLEDFRQPYELALGGTEGKYLVLVWDESEPFSVREFTVTVRPNNPGAVGFAGQWLDEETGLYYHGSRYRLPRMGGKFICPDPLGFVDGENLYAYAQNDPLTWHDPDGEFAHIAIGAGVGGLLGGGGYLLQVCLTGEEFSWAKLGIYTGAGAVSGALASATWGASTAWSAGHLSLSAGKTVIVAGSLSGAVGGGTHGLVSAGGVTYLNTGDAGLSLGAAGKAMLKQGGLGALGGAAGGAVLSRLGASFPGMVLSGGAGGTVAGATGGGIAGFRETGAVGGTLRAAAEGAIIGGAVGATIGAASWGVGRATNRIRTLADYPSELSNPRKGVLVRTKRAPNVSYGEAKVQVGMARHHVKPLSLGGADTPENIKMVSKRIHIKPHPSKATVDAPYGSLFY